eukprot:12018-Eustigmatos_ZCMA.PRE.1
MVEDLAHAHNTKSPRVWVRVMGYGAQAAENISKGRFHLRDKYVNRLDWLLVDPCRQSSPKQGFS